jgi:hypothetical protein
MRLTHDWYDNIELHEWCLIFGKCSFLMVQWEAPGRGWGWHIERIDGGKCIGIFMNRLLVTVG